MEKKSITRYERDVILAALHNTELPRRGKHNRLMLSHHNARISLIAHDLLTLDLTEHSKEGLLILDVERAYSLLCDFICEDKFHDPILWDDLFRLRYDSLGYTIEYDTHSDLWDLNICSYIPEGGIIGTYTYLYKEEAEGDLSVLESIGWTQFNKL